MKPTIDDLPPSLKRLARLIGVEAVIKLVKRFGGKRIYIPSKPIWGHAIHQTIGIEKFNILCFHFASQQIAIPKGKRLFSKLRYREEVVNRFDAISGDSIMCKAKKIGSELGITAHYVYMLAREAQIA